MVSIAPPGGDTQKYVKFDKNKTTNQHNVMKLTESPASASSFCKEKKSISNGRKRIWVNSNMHRSHLIKLSINEIMCPWLFRRAL